MCSSSIRNGGKKEEQRGKIRFLMAEGAATRIKSKRPGILLDGIILLHDNARPHTANLVKDKLQRFDWEINQHPPYIPDFSPLLLLFFFRELKKDIPGRFSSDEEVQEWVRLWVSQRPTSFYKTGIDRLISEWDKCINSSGKYF